MTTLRRLSAVSAVAAGAVAFSLAPAPAHAYALIGDFVVLYAVPPTLAQLAALQSVSSSVHSLAPLPEASVVAPSDAVPLILAQPGVIGVNPLTP